METQYFQELETTFLLEFSKLDVENQKNILFKINALHSQSIETEIKYLKDKIASNKRVVENQERQLELLESNYGT